MKTKRVRQAESADRLWRAMEELERAIGFASVPDDGDAFFPHIWACGGRPGDGCKGKPVTDPTTIYFTLDDNGLIESTTVGDLVDDAMELHVDPRTGRIDGERAGLMRDIAESLRDHANRIEHALEHGYTMRADNGKQ